ncbi:MAG: hypothetical protein II915_05770, partial [Eubacterium sp.]|nr:hypothetical protein [Eubacterium sp.]
DEYNINYYGVHDSVLKNLNQAMFCGSAKCPYTTLSWSNTTAATPGKFIYYDAKGNKTSHTQGVSWIGNCLFKDMNTGSNDFTLLFTKSGGGEGQDIKNALTNNMWTIMYYDVY